MPLLAFIPVVIYLTVAVGGGIALYQLRMSVESVEEIFTNEGSTLNSIAFQAIAGAAVLYFITRGFK